MGEETDTIGVDVVVDAVVDKESTAAANTDATITTTTTTTPTPSTTKSSIRQPPGSEYSVAPVEEVSSDPLPPPVEDSSDDGKLPPAPVPIGESDTPTSTTLTTATATATTTTTTEASASDEPQVEDQMKPPADPPLRPQHTSHIKRGVLPEGMEWTYESLTAFSAAVAAHNLKSNKKVVTYQRKSSGGTRCFKCADYITKEKVYEAQVRSQLRNPEHSKEYLKQNPFDGIGACPFDCRANRPGSFRKSSGTIKFNVSPNCVWVHSATCTSVGTVTTAQINSNAEFRAVVTAHGGKATGKAMANAIQKGLGSTVEVARAALYRAQSKLRIRKEGREDVTSSSIVGKKKAAAANANAGKPKPASKKATTLTKAKSTPTAKKPQGGSGKDDDGVDPKDDAIADSDKADTAKVGNDDNDDNDEELVQPPPAVIGNDDKDDKGDKDEGKDGESAEDKAADDVQAKVKSTEETTKEINDSIADASNFVADSTLPLLKLKPLLPAYPKKLNVPEGVKPTYDSLAKFGADVAANALAQNKRVVTYQRKSSGSTRCYRCTDFLAKEKNYEIQVKSQLQTAEIGVDTNSSDSWLARSLSSAKTLKLKQYLRKHPFDGKGACTFEVRAARPGSLRKTDGVKVQKFNVSPNCVWTHTATCTSVGVVTSAQLSNNEQFRAVVETSNGKASAKALSTAASEGLGGIEVPRAALYRAQLHMRNKIAERKEREAKEKEKAMQEPRDKDDKEKEGGQDASAPKSDDATATTTTTTTDTSSATTNTDGTTTTLPPPPPSTTTSDPSTTTSDPTATATTTEAIDTESATTDGQHLLPPPPVLDKDALDGTPPPPPPSVTSTTTAPSSITTTTAAVTTTAKAPAKKSTTTLSSKMKARQACKKCTKAGRTGDRIYSHKGTCPYEASSQVENVTIVLEDVGDDDATAKATLSSGAEGTSETLASPHLDTTTQTEHDVAATLSSIDTIAIPTPTTNATVSTIAATPTETNDDDDDDDSASRKHKRDDVTDPEEEEQGRPKRTRSAKTN